MYNFSIEIPDKLATDFESKLKVSTSLGINNIEIVDKIDNISLHEMTGAQTENIRNLLIDYGKRIVLYTTLLDVNDKENLNMLFRRALTLNIKGIKIVPKQNDDLSFVTKLSKAYGIPLLIENNADSFLDSEFALKEVIYDKNIRFSTFIIQAK